MKKLLIASLLILAGAGSAMAAPEGFPNLYYMMYDLKTGQCMLMASAPTSSRYKMMGAYKTVRAASRAMRRTTECQA